MKYRREIDGLRTVAVLPVILFHAGYKVFSGGFVGVDVFFVISGFLITSILIGEMQSGTFSMANFFERRARRILPALYFVILCCIPVGYVVLLPNQLEDFAQSIMATMLFGSNILFWREVGYFAPAAEFKPLLHTWSLAVEEQYYLLFPPVLWLLWRLGRRVVFGCVVAVALLSLGLSEWGWRNSPTANFFLLPTRAWELLAGSICAFLSVGQSQRSSNVLSGLGLALILYAIFAFDGSVPFPSVYALLPVGGTCLIILFAGPGTFARWLLSTTPFVAIGLVSYSAYLWHQPLFAFARVGTLTEPSLWVMSALAVASVVLAWVSWRFVEAPFRNRTTGPLVRQRSVFLVTGGFGVLLLCIGAVGHVTQGLPGRAAGTGSIGALQDRIAPNYGLNEACNAHFKDIAECRTGTSPSVVLWGDSFAMHLASGLEASAEGTVFQQHTKNSCAPVLGLVQLDIVGAENWARGCIDYNQRVLEWLLSQEQVDLVVMSSMLQMRDGDRLLREDGAVITQDLDETIAAGVARTVEAVRATGARVVWVSPTPRQHWDVGQCLVRSVMYGRGDAACDFDLQGSQGLDGFLAGIEANVPVYHIAKDMCPSGRCDTQVDGVFIYQDSGHLTYEGSAALGQTHDWLSRWREMAR